MSEPLHESANQAGEPQGEHAWAADHIASYVAAGLATTDRLRMFRHLQNCEECRRAVAELQMMDEEMRQLFADVHPPADLETRTVQAVRREPRPVRARVRRAAWSGPMKAMMVAAAAMLLIGVGAFLSESPRFRESVTLAARYDRPPSYFGSVEAFDSSGSMSSNHLKEIPPSGSNRGDGDGERKRSFAFGNDWTDSDESFAVGQPNLEGARRGGVEYSYIAGAPDPHMPTLGLIVPSDGRSHTYSSGKGGKATDFHQALDLSPPQGRSESAPQSGPGGGSMTTVNPQPSGVVSGVTPLGALRQALGGENAESAKSGGGGGGGGGGHGGGGRGFGGGGFGNGRGVPDKKADVVKDLGDNVKNTQNGSVNFGMGLNYDAINNTVLGGRSVTSSSSSTSPTPTKGSAATTWSVPVPGFSFPAFSDTTGAATGSPSNSKASGGDKRMDDVRAGAPPGLPLRIPEPAPAPAPSDPAGGPGRDKVRREIEERLSKMSSEADGSKRSADSKKEAESKKEPTVENLPQAKDSPASDVKEPGTPKEELPAIASPVVAQQPPQKSDPVAAQPPATQPLATQHRKIIIRSGEMEFEIDSFDAAVASIVHIISTTKDGFVATVNSEKLANGKMRGSVVVRMPPERLDDFVLELRKTLAKTGDLKGQRIGSQDVTKHYTDLESELKAHRTMESRLLDILKNGKGAVKDLLAVEKDLGVYREKIEKIEGELRYYANLAALSTLTITLQEKEIRAAAAYTETERVNTGIEVEEVEKAYQEAQAAVREMKGRISQAEMKQQAAGQFNAKLVFEIAPEQAGPMRDRLRQLGNMVRLEMDRVQKIENGGEPSKVGNLDGKIRRGDTEFTVSIYNLANVEPRETTMLTLVAADVPAAYQKLRTVLSKLKTTMRNAALQENDKTRVEAGVDFDVRRVDEPAAQQALDAAGEVVFRRSLRQAEGNNLTDAKVRFTVRILSTSTIEPRETIHRLITVPDVAAAYRRVQETVTAKEIEAQMKVATLQQTDRNNVNGTLDFVIRRSDEAAVRKLVDELGETLTRQSDQKLGDGVTDAKVRYDLRFIPETSVDARDQVEAKLATKDVPSTYRKLRTLVEGLKGQIRGATIQENDRVDIQASLDLVVAKDDEGAVQAALSDLGEVLNRTSKRRPESERVTNSKIEFSLKLVSAAAEIKARKKYQIEEIVDKVDARLTEFNDAVLKAGGRVVGVPRDEALKSGGASGSVIYEVPLAAVEGIVARIRAATLDNRFVQVVTEDASAPEGKLAIARVELRIATPDFLVSRENDFDAQLRYGLSVALSWLIRSASWLIAGLVFFLPWVIVIGAIVLLTRFFRRTPAPVPAVASVGESAATPPTP